MFVRARNRLLQDQHGFTLIEGLVAGILLLSAMTATYGLLATSGRAEQDQRMRSQSYAIAQEDQARMRSLRVSQLMTLNQTRTVVQDGSTYTVVSKGQYVNDQSGTASCDEGTSSADYIKISSTVSWQGSRDAPPTVIESLIAPPNGTFGADRGTLAIAVRDGAGNPVSGLPLSGTGAGTFSGSTGTNGCATFTNLPEGDYTLTPGTAMGVVDKDGKAPSPQTVSVVGQSTNTVALQYDSPGTLRLSFKTRIGGTVQASKADSIVVFNSGMTTAKAFGTIGDEQSTITTTSLFPFASQDTVYAGSCTANNPNPTNIVNPPAAAALVSATVLKNQLVTVTPSIQLPALQLTVRTGTSSTNQGSIVSNAAITITDTGCTSPAVKRTYTNRTTGSPTGLVPTGQSTVDPGMPYGVYDICAYNGSRRNTLTAVPVQTTATDTTRTIYLGSGATGSTTGACP